VEGLPEPYDEEKVIGTPQSEVGDFGQNKETRSEQKDKSEN
jgi:hypothetical protein